MLHGCHSHRIGDMTEYCDRSVTNPVLLTVNRRYLGALNQFVFACVGGRSPFAVQGMVILGLIPRALAHHSVRACVSFFVSISYLSGNLYLVLC